MPLYSLSPKPKSSAKKEVVIFDFDGVLADSFSYFYSLIRDSMAEISLPFSPEQYRRLFTGNIHQGFKNYIKDETKLKKFLNFRKNNYNRYYFDKQKGVKLFPGCNLVLKRLSKKYVLTIASSGYTSNINKLLRDNKVKDFFSLVLAGTATTKEGMLRKIIKDYQVNPKKTTMITDTLGDLKVAKKIGLKTVAVTWGFHSKKVLMSGCPDKICDKIEDLLKK